MNEARSPNAARNYGFCIAGVGVFLLIAMVGFINYAAREGEVSTNSAVMLVYSATVGTALLGTAVLNLWAGRLLVVPTIAQIVFAILSCYGIPFAIWGIALLRRRPEIK